MSAGAIGYDLYYGITNAKGKTRVAYARVWDGQRFIEAQRAAGAKAEKKEDRFTITSATREDYLRDKDCR